MEALKIGILGTGVIAATLADTMNRMPGVELYGAASRSLEKAKDFGERFGVKCTYGSYEELVADPEIELVYIAPLIRSIIRMRFFAWNMENMFCVKRLLR